MLKLDDYSITKDRGFLTPYDMDEVDLPEIFADIATTAMALPQLIPTSRVRHFLGDVEEVDKQEFDGLSAAQRRLLMVHYSFAVQAYIWGEDMPATTLPRNLAVPYCYLADLTGQFPLLPYASYTLDNWAKIEPEGGVTLDNIYVIQNFLGGQDENWFILVHVEIEATAGRALAAIPDLLVATAEKDTAKVEARLGDILGAWRDINPIFDRMPERCDPHTYYRRVRPYIHGWKDNPALPDGLFYEGVDKYAGQGQLFRGQTGSQSSIVPTMDALLGVRHEADEFRAYLDDLHEYRPPGHRKFIEDVAKASALRDFVKESDNRDIKDLYNDILDHVMNFRTRHLEYAASYINKQARSAEGNPTEIGTGGTPFMAYLKKHRDETERTKLAHRVA